MELANFTVSPIHSLPTLICPTFHPCLVKAYQTRFLLCLVPPSLPSLVTVLAFFLARCGQAILPYKKTHLRRFLGSTGPTQPGCLFQDGVITKSNRVMLYRAFIYVISGGLYRIYFFFIFERSPNPFCFTCFNRKSIG